MLQAESELERLMSAALQLRPALAPTVVRSASGVADDFVRSDHKVKFALNSDEPRQDSTTLLELPLTLVKWKRHALKRYRVEPGHGLLFRSLTLKNNITPGSVNSVEVKKLDFEAVIRPEDRCMCFLKDVCCCLPMMSPTQTLTNAFTTPITVCSQDLRRHARAGKLRLLKDWCAAAAASRSDLCPHRTTAQGLSLLITKRTY
jgi:Aspartate-ammonia ligase